jgi:hypothetical protein
MKTLKSSILFGWGYPYINITVSSNSNSEGSRTFHKNSLTNDCLSFLLLFLI